MAGLDMVTSTLIKETDSKNAYWMSPITLASLDVPAKAYLLPGFDEYMLGYKDRTAALDRRHAQKIAPENNGRFMSTGASLIRLFSVSWLPTFWAWK
jgi:hypothetical protein